MKKITILLVSLTVHIITLAQSVGIGTTTPNVHSILDLRNANSRALLLPWATIDARNALTSLSSGGMIYQNSASSEEPQGIYFKIGSQWRYLMTNNDIKKTWEKVSDEIQYSATEKIGIGTNDPRGYLHIKATEDAERFSLRMQGSFPSLVFEHGSLATGSYNEKAFIYANSGGLIFSNSSFSPTTTMKFRLGNIDRVMLEADGTLKTKSEIRLTDNTFAEKGFLQLNGDDMRVGTVSGNNTGSFVVRTNGQDNFSVNAAGDVVPANNIQFYEGAVQKAFIQRNGDDLRLGVNADNSTGNVVMRLNGADHFRFDNDGRMTLMNESSPTIHFQVAGVNQGSIQQQGVNLAINATGNQVRLNSFMYVDGSTNRVGISNSAPEEKLHVQGNIKVSTGKVLNNSNDNMLPYGYAIFRADGTKARGTSTLTGSWIGNDFYLAASDGSDISDGILSVTCYNARVTASFIASGNRLRISFFDEDGDQFQVAFSAVLYK